MWPNTGPLTNKFQELLDFINQYSTNPNESMQHLITEIVQQGNEALQKPLLTDKKIKIKINDWKRLQSKPQNQTKPPTKSKSILDSTLLNTALTQNFVQTPSNPQYLLVSIDPNGGHEHGSDLAIVALAQTNTHAIIVGIGAGVFPTHNRLKKALHSFINSLLERFPESIINILVERNQIRFPDFTADLFSNDRIQFVKGDAAYILGIFTTKTRKVEYIEAIDSTVRFNRLCICKTLTLVKFQTPNEALRELLQQLDAIQLQNEGSGFTFSKGRQHDDLVIALGVGLLWLKSLKSPAFQAANTKCKLLEQRLQDHALPFTTIPPKTTSEHVTEADFTAHKSSTDPSFCPGTVKDSAPRITDAQETFTIDSTPDVIPDQLHTRTAIAFMPLSIVHISVHKKFIQNPPPEQPPKKYVNPKLVQPIGSELEARNIAQCTNLIQLAMKCPPGYIKQHPKSAVAFAKRHPFLGAAVRRYMEWKWSQPQPKPTQKRKPETPIDLKPAKVHHPNEFTLHTYLAHTPLQGLDAHPQIQFKSAAKTAIKPSLWIKLKKLF